MDGAGTGEKCGFVRKRIGFAGGGSLFVCLLNVGFRRLYFRNFFEQNAETKQVYNRQQHELCLLTVSTRKQMSHPTLGLNPALR